MGASTEVTNRGSRVLTPWETKVAKERTEQGAEKSGHPRWGVTEGETAVQGVDVGKGEGLRKETWWADREEKVEKEWGP